MAGLSPVALTTLLGVLGLLAGSFLNVVIARVPLGLSVVRPPSRCPGCGHQLAWYENVPVASWILLRGCCRSCRQKISARYPVIELLTALLFVGCGIRFEMGWQLLRALVLVGFLVPLAFIDIEHWILPFELTLPGTAAGLLLSIPLGMGHIAESAIGAAVGFGFLWSLETLLRTLLRKEALGAGDKYVMGLVGAFLGYRPLLGVILLSNLQGALVGGALLLARGRAGPTGPPPNPDPEQQDDWQPGPSHVPFGPWIALAAIELLLLGPWLEQTFPGTFTAILTGDFGDLP